MEMPPLPPAAVRRVDVEFEAWERLRRQLVRREAAWAAAVAAHADRRRLARLRRERAELQQALDAVFDRAMGTLEAALARRASQPAASSS
jgi:hypothetical protein